MKVTLIQENLSKALNHISKAVSNRPNIPVLANVLLETEKGKLKLSATNLDIGISTWVGATVETEGKVTVSAKLLSEFVNTLKPGKLDIFQNSQTLVVKSVDNHAVFYVIPADDFPSIPGVEGEAILELNALDFADAIAKTAFAAGTDESRPVLTGVLFTAEKKKLTMVAIDSFRLSKKEMSLSKEVSTGITEIVPAKSLMDVEKLIKDVASEKDNIQIYIMEGKNQMLFKIGDIEFSTRLIEGKFPEFDQILPKENNLKFRAKTADFNNMIKVVSIFARNVVGNKAKMKIDTDQQKVTLAANVIDVGNNESTIPIKSIEGDDMESAYNVKFLTDMINAITADEIIFESNGPIAPGVFLDPNDKNYIHVIMPMRLE